MRLLFCVDTDKNLDTISRRLSKVLNLFREDLFYIDILHVYQKPEADAPHMPATMLKIQKDEERLRMTFLADCQRRVTDLLQKKLKKASLINSHLKRGKFFSCLKDHIKFHKYDMLVLLPGKKDPLQLLLMGRNVTRILSNVKVPLLILPKSEEFTYRNTSLVAMLEKPKKHKKKFENTQVIRQVYDGSLQYLHIDKEGKAQDDDVEVIVHKNKIKAFNDYHLNRKKNHIYILNHNRKEGLAKWKKSSFTRAVISKTDASIMVI